MIDIKKPVDRKRPITATVVTNKKSQYQIMKVQPEPPISPPQINSPAPKIARQTPIDELRFSEQEIKSPGQMFVDEEFPAKLPSTSYASASRRSRALARCS